MDFQGAAGVWGLGDTDPIWEELLPGVIGCWPVWPVPDAVRPGEEVGFDEVGSELRGNWAELDLEWDSEAPRPLGSLAKDE